MCEAIVTELGKFDYNVDQIMNRNALVLVVRGQKDVYSMTCANAEAAIDVIFALEQEGFDLRDTLWGRGGAITFSVYAPRPDYEGVKKGRMKDEK